MSLKKLCTSKAKTPRLWGVLHGYSKLLIDGLNELAKRQNSSANRLLENSLFELLKKRVL